MNALAPDPFLDERVLRAAYDAARPAAPVALANRTAADIGAVWSSVRRLVADGLLEWSNDTDALVTPLGERRALDLMAAALNDEMQAGFRAERDAIVAAAVDVMDEANTAKILALLGRSSETSSRELLAKTIGEDQDTVDELVGRLVADGLVEPRMNGLAFVATDEGRRRAADMTDAEMQELFSSERDAIVASAGALMASDPADVLWAEAAEEDRQRTGLIASVTYDGIDPHSIATRQGGSVHHEATEKPSRVALASADEAAVNNAVEAAQAAQAEHRRSRTPESAQRMASALAALRDRLEELNKNLRRQR